MAGNIFHEEFIRRISAQEYIDRDELLIALREPSPVSIRINKAKWNKLPADGEAVPWCRNGYYLPSRPSYTLDPLFHSGCYYPQEASGMFLEQVLLQSAGSLRNLHVLDLCGAPGGKSILLSDMIGPDSLLVANDVIRSRASILAETITKWGSDNTIVTQSDPSAFGRLPGFFDIIMVDAPCSGEGMFRTDIAVSEWSPENAALCVERQKRILNDIWPCLKENGILIYSTCTFNPDENENNIRLLTGRKEAESLRLDLKSFEGIKEIDLEGIFGYGFYPDKVRGEGFFIAAIRKRGREENKFQGSHRIPDMRPGKSDCEVVSAWTDFKNEKLLKWGDEIIAVPCALDEYAYLYKNLKIIKAGTLVHVRKNDDCIPSQELALSAGIKEDTFPRQELTLEEAVSYLRRDTIAFRNLPIGWIIVTYKGINLGFIKNLGKRVNNYYPVEWRIRLDASAMRSTNPVTWLE